MIKTLYIIGNGLDIHHSLETDYKKFAKYFKRYYPQLFEETFYYYPTLLDVQDRLWSDFENQLAEVDNNQILEDNYVYLNSPYSPDFRDRDWHNFSYEIGKMVDQIKFSIDKLFKKWIDLINVEKGSKYKFEHISENYYISFNYTKTLETLYKVPPTSILHIHGESKTKQPLIFGHNKRYNYEQNEDSDMAYIFGQQQIERFFIETRKDTDKVILINNTLFKKLKDVDTVFVLGHSLNDIDLPYFKKISKSLKKYVEWHVSYFDEKDKCKIMNVFSTLNIKFKLIKISDVFQ